MIKKWFLFALLPCVAFAGSLSAQDNAQGEEEIVANISFHTMLFFAGGQFSVEDEREGREPPKPELPPLYYYSGGAYHPVDFRVQDVQGPWQYSGPPTLTFHRRERAADGTYRYPRYMEVPFSPEWGKVMVMGMPQAGYNESMKTIAIRTSDQNLPEGRIRVYNLSPKTIVIRIIDERAVLNQYDHMDVDIRNIKNYSVPVAIALKDKEDYKLVYKKVWAVFPKSRSVYLLFSKDKDFRRWLAHSVPLNRID